MIRLFAGVPVPGEIAERLVRHQQGVPGANWRPAESLHVTLRFAGDIPENLADDFAVELSRVSGEPLTLTLCGVGAFGEGERIHAVWAGLEDNPALRRLAARCEAAARRAGLKPDKRLYTPHVTLAYLRRPDPARVAAWIQSHNLLKSPPFAAPAFALYSSHLSTEGSRYAVERLYPLR
jgi:2'-5' RNA ligase